MSRKQSREIVFKLIFQLAFSKSTELLDDKSIGLVAGEEKIDEAEMKYIEKLCNAVADNINAIDETIKALSKDFTFDRIYKTDLTALRMGIGEIKFFNDTPAIVAVNEAVEIAKKYGSEKSGAFVNGILAAVVAGAAK